jgi:hypothetical protein
MIETRRTMPASVLQMMAAMMPLKDGVSSEECSYTGSEYMDVLCQRVRGGMRRGGCG